MITEDKPKNIFKDVSELEIEKALTSLNPSPEKRTQSNQSARSNESTPSKLNESTHHDETKREKTALRLKYEAEVSVIKGELGGLEEIRHHLSLSKRKISQLLMVDPSSWTRWTKDGEDAPPHIYRSLQWFLSLTKKEPAWHPQNSFGRVAQMQNEKVYELEKKIDQQIKSQAPHTSHLDFNQSELKEGLEDIKNETSSLWKQMQQSSQAQIAWKWKALLVLNLVLSTALILIFIFNK